MKNRTPWVPLKPSVRQFVTVEGQQRDLFHNTYDWQVQYVEMVHQEPGLNQQHLQHDADNRYATLMRLNNPDITDDERRADFINLAAAGIIY